MKTTMKEIEEITSKVLRSLPLQKRESPIFKAKYCKDKDHTFRVERNKVVKHQTILCPICGSNSIGKGD